MPKTKKKRLKKKKKKKNNLFLNLQWAKKGEHEPFVHQGRTSPPKPYTEATLLRAMETAGRQVEDEELRELLKNNGIGRPFYQSKHHRNTFKKKIHRKEKKIFSRLKQVLI